MLIEVGLKYQIANEIQSFYNSADTLTVTRLNQGTVQFILGEGKSRGAMPIQHMQYLLKRSELTLVSSKRAFVEEEQSEKDIS